MGKVVLISCVSTKLEKKAKASDLYISPLFKMNYAYAKMLKPTSIYILSAKYGLLNPDTIIEPYNETLNTMKNAQIKDWAIDVIDQMEGKIDFKKDEIIFLAGERYRKFLMPLCRNAKVPLLGLGIGKQLGWLKRKLEDKRHETTDNAKLF
ncbi:MAG: DUF6884 domain-containing protein [Candidatus Paceibacterota bacterium]